MTFVKVPFVPYIKLISFLFNGGVKKGVNDVRIIHHKSTAHA